jgi:large subunit ribosomal protein L9
MKVILQEDVPSLGSTGDVKDVRDGYGRNFLLPRKLAILADAKNTRRLEHQKRVAAARHAKVMAGAKDLAAKINGTPISIKRQGGAEDKIFGSVTNIDIAEALAAQGIVVERKHVVLDEPIRNVGVFQVPVRLLREVEATVKVYVIRG